MNGLLDNNTNFRILIPRAFIWAYHIFTPTNSTADTRQNTILSHLFDLLDFFLLLRNFEISFNQISSFTKVEKVYFSILFKKAWPRYIFYFHISLPNLKLWLSLTGVISKWHQVHLHFYEFYSTSLYYLCPIEVNNSAALDTKKHCSMCRFTRYTLLSCICRCIGYHHSS